MVRVVGSGLHPEILMDLLTFDVGIGNNQLVICADGEQQFFSIPQLLKTFRQV